MPTGRSPKVDVHQPTATSTPTATPVRGHGHFPCSGSRAPREIHVPPAAARTAITIHGESPSALATVGEPPLACAIVRPGAASAARTGASTPTVVAVAPIANPSSTTHAPIAPSPTRYHVLPEQPPDRIMPTPNSAPPSRLAAQR